MKMNIKEYIKIAIGIFLLYLAVTYWKYAANIISMIVSAATPLIIGAIIAYFVNILMTFYERHYFVKSKKRLILKCRRGLCMIGAYVTIIAIISLVIGIVLPQFVSCLQLLFKELPAVLSFLTNKIGELKILPENMREVLIGVDWSTQISGIASALTSGVGNIMNVAVKALSGVFSGIVSGVLSIIFSVYLLLGKDRLRNQLTRLAKHYLSKKWYDRLVYLVKVLDDSFHNYIIGQCTEAVVLGVLCTVGMFILRIPYAPMIGALVGFTALIPVAGAYVGAFMGALMLLTVSPVKSLVFLIYILVLQQIEGNLIYPKVVGNSIGLPGIWVLAAVTIGGGIMGISGMLFGVPIAATVYKIIKDDINR